MSTLKEANKVLDKLRSDLAIANKEVERIQSRLNKWEQIVKLIEENQNETSGITQPNGKSWNETVQNIINSLGGSATIETMVKSYKTDYPETATSLIEKNIRVAASRLTKSGRLIASPASDSDKRTKKYELAK